LVYLIYCTTAEREQSRDENKFKTLSNCHQVSPVAGHFYHFNRPAKRNGGKSNGQV